MLYLDDNLNLTIREMERTLLSAGISPDVSTWDTETVKRAAQVLDKAKTDKVTRILLAPGTLEHSQITINPCGQMFFADVTLGEYTAHGPLRKTRKGAERWAHIKAKTIATERANYLSYKSQ